jgi:hypothetical protein
MKLGWLKSVPGSRALQLTSSGKAGLSEIFRIDIDHDAMQAGGNRFAMRRTTADSLG